MSKTSVKNYNNRKVNLEEKQIFEKECSYKFLEKNLEKILKIEKEKIHRVCDFFYRSIYVQNLIFDFDVEKEEKEKIMAIYRIIEYFLEHKFRWPATITSSESVVRYIKNYCAPDRETFIAIYLNSHHTILNSVVISYGTTDFAMINVKMIFSYALKLDASRLILVHNHPSGDPSPSNEDISFTDKINSLAKDFGIILLDHIIIANTYYSFKAEGLL